ncbi:hypothetical protein AMAG_07865 [Allomyces macrogynus ATCC 38327]|uniref:Uncharacterized protein n=1 Tax=Allomyces macrogynus (strain ATCC 38327) TaxID=578462 RepID=A0A0L0SJL2_ALLM3|nr:hypothetical protein AMAG_07865 [Allomyces macrogynus ATCC 38327]|eukprot:KNE62672.1 hypothetical protein AMAG_07865 [Allomyces macrogynus ATCC 38327]
MRSICSLTQPTMPPAAAPAPRSRSPPPQVLAADASTYQYEPAWRARNRRAVAAARALRADHARAVASVATSRAAWHAARRTYVNHVACALRVVEARHAVEAKSKPKSEPMGPVGCASDPARSGRDAWTAAAVPDHRHAAIDDSCESNDNDDEADPSRVERAQEIDTDDEVHAPPMLARLSQSLAALGPVPPRGPGPIREEVGAQGRAWVNLTDLQSLDLLHLAGLARSAGK